MPSEDATILTIHYDDGTSNVLFLRPTMDVRTVVAGAMGMSVKDVSGYSVKWTSKQARYSNMVA